MAAQPVTAAIKRHWDRVAQIGCIVTRSPVDVTLHHARGGSMKEVGVHRKGGRRNDHWLVIPLTARLHTGDDGIDQMGHTVKSWEAMYGRQVDHLDEVCRRLGVNVWRQAGIDRDVPTGTTTNNEGERE